MDRIGLVLGIIAAVACAFLHVATFISTIPPVWVLPTLIPLAAIAATYGAKNIGPDLKYKPPPPLSKRAGLIAVALVLYGIGTFIYVYKTTDGMTSVAIVNGQYVSMSKGHVLRTLTEYEYRLFPTLVARVLSAWIGVMAVLFYHAVKDSAPAGTQ